MNGRPPFVGLVLLAHALALSGCAVLTIDVDVYKGPLANHEDVQSEQMAAMAIGAKPLLVHLRDDLERQSRNRKQKKRFEKKRRLRAMPAYRFESEHADRVDDILGLYENREDLTDPEIAMLAARAEEAISTYATAKDIFRPEDVEPAVSRWKDLNKAMHRVFRETPDNAGLAEHPLIAEKGMSKETLTALRDGYRELLTHTRLQKRPAKKIFSAHQQLSEKLTDLVQPQLDATDPQHASSNSLFTALTREEIVDAHTDLLFPNTEVLARQDFKSAVIAKANAFLTARAALDALFTTTLRSIIVVNTRVDISLSTQNRVTSEASALAVELIEPAHLNALLYAAYRRSEDPTEPIRRMDLPPTLEGVRDSMQSMLPGIFDKERDEFWKKENNRDQLKKSYELERRDRQRFEHALQRALIANPASTAQALLDAHSFFQGANVLTDKDVSNAIGLPQRYQWPISRKFGLAIGPLLHWEHFQAFIDLARAFKASLVYGPFARGRLEEGLEKLIEHYLNATRDAELGRYKEKPGGKRGSTGSGAHRTGYKRDGKQKEKVERTRRVLIDALVRFAEKVLFIANNEKLLDGEETKTRPYIQVLQAVGNSILVQADELQHRKEHEERQATRAEWEVKAQHNAGWGEFRQKFDKPHDHKHGAKDVLDKLIALLEYEYIMALKQAPPEGSRAEDKDDDDNDDEPTASGRADPASRPDADPTSRAENEGGDVAADDEPKSDAHSAEALRKALEAAYDYRSRMIYLRPPSAYLRTSYPATTLQRKSKETWKNMLLEHGVRQIPFFGVSKDERERARIVQEIDKQFWQNINRVRVAGAGVTNYVIAKDDIGNWYVKNYSANPEKIINSAKSLALYSLGAPAPALPAGTGEAGAGDAKSDAPPSALERLLERYRDEYNNRTTNDFESLEGILKRKKIEERIRADFQTATEGIAGDRREEMITQLKRELNLAARTSLESAQKAFTEARKKTPHGVEPPLGAAEVIISAMGSMRRFHNDLVSGIGDLELKRPEAEALQSAEEDLSNRREQLEQAESALAALKQAPDAAEEAVAEATTTVARERAAVDDATTALEKAQQAHEAAVQTEKLAIRQVTRRVGEVLTKVAGRRWDAVRDYEGALAFIGAATQQ